MKTPSIPNYSPPQKVGIVLSSKTSPEMLDLITSSIQNARTEEFYTITKMGVTKIKAGQELRQVESMCLRQMLGHTARWDELDAKAIERITKSTADVENLMGMKIVADVAEDAKLLNPLIVISNKPAIILTRNERPANSQLVDGMIVLPMVKQKQTFDYPALTVLNEAIKTNNSNLQLDPIDTVNEILETSTLMRLDKQVIGLNKDYTTMYEPVTKTATMVHRRKDIAYSYNVTRTTLVELRDGKTEEISVSKSQAAEYLEKLKKFDKVLAQDTKDR